MKLLGVSWRKIWWVLAIPILCWVFVIAVYLSKFNGSLSDKQEVWGQFSDYAGGLINPVISLVGLVAVIITLRANVTALDETRRQLRSQMFAESESHFVTLEQLLASVPSALKFHGIDPSELEKAGVTPQEFAYLMANFTAGGVNVRALNESDTSPFIEGDYYRVMLESSHTRSAWPLIQKLMTASPYKQRIQATINLIEERESAVTQRDLPHNKTLLSTETLLASPESSKKSKLRG